MPRTNPKPLSIGVHGPDLYESPAIQAFIKKGHQVFLINAVDYDVIIGPTCWRIDPRLRLGDDKTEDESLERQLEMMEAGIRAIKFPKVKDDKTTKEK